MENNKLVVLETPELKGVEPSKAAAIKAVFEPMVQMLEGMEAAYNSVMNEAKEGITPEVMAKAKNIRLAIAKVRTTTEASRKEQKSQYLVAGKAIDGVANILKFAVSEKEDNLKKIETHFERIEAERIARIKAEREELLKPFVEDVTVYDLGRMEAEVWNIFLGKKEIQYREAIEAERTEKRLQAERMQKLADMEKIEKENARLKAELEVKAKATADVIQDQNEIRNLVSNGTTDLEKFAMLIKDFDALKTKYSFDTAVGKDAYRKIGGLMDKLIDYTKKFASNES